MRFLNKKWLIFTVLGLLLIMLAACGDTGTATSLPSTAVASVQTSSVPVMGTPGAIMGDPGAVMGTPVSGTIESYDATTKTLTVKTADGSSQKFGVSNARISKAETLTAAEFGKLTATSVVRVTGDKASDGTYTATSLSLMDMNGAGGPGGGQNQPPAGQTPPTGQAQPAGGFPGGQPGQDMANAPVIVQGGTITGNTLSGTTFTGETIKVTLSSTTTYTRQATATATDLKSGAKVIITALSAQGTTPVEAINIALS